MFCESQKSKAILGIAGLFILCFGSVLPASSSTPFVSETVDSTGDVGEYTSLTQDAQGNTYISYYDHHFARRHHVRG